MQRAQIVYDGLWRCLCPAFDRAALQQAVRTPVIAPSTSTCQRTRNVPRYDWTQKRLFGTENFAAVRPSIEQDAEPRYSSDLAHSPPRRNLDELLLAPTAPKESTLEEISTADLKMALEKIRLPQGYSVHGQVFDRHERIHQLVDYLIRSRGLPLDSFVYECKMDAMIDPKGSARAIRALMKSMGEQGIIPTMRICQSALAALAVHPDYALREQVLDTMGEYWFGLDLVNEQHVVLGMLRDGQYELAYDKLMGFVEEGARIDLWTYDIFIMVFGQQGFLDEMLQLLLRRKQAQGSGNVVLSVLYYVLDICSSAAHYQGTIFAWNATVRNGLVMPSDGILENVLATAAREGDVELATEVHSIISGRSRVQIHHFDALIEAFARDKNIPGALRVLSIMQRNGLPILRENTRPIYEALRNNKALLEEAETTIRKSAIEGPVHSGIVSVVLEAMVKTGGTATAMPLYKDVESLTGSLPTAVMIQDMIINSENFDHTRACLGDYRDYISSQEQPPPRLPMAYNKLISACLDFKELDLAFRFAHGAVRTKHSKSVEPIWLKKLTTVAIQVEDGRIWELYDSFRDSGNKDATSSMKRLSRLMRTARRARERKDAADAAEATNT